MTWNWGSPKGKTFSFKNNKIPDTPGQAGDPAPLPGVPVPEGHPCPLRKPPPCPQTERSPRGLPAADRLLPDPETLVHMWQLCGQGGAD